LSDIVTLLDPSSIDRNEDNPRLIFRSDDLLTLEQSISDQGILVPLTVFKEGRLYRLLDGERRWRCAKRLGLSRVPVIVQPKPERLQNIMMMFAIHHARRDWDPLPTALKLLDLEGEFKKQHGRIPSEPELAGLASLSRGEVRRLRKLINLPDRYRQELLDELEKPKSKQVLTVDHVLEATTAASLLRKQDIVDAAGEDDLRQAIISKFKSGTIVNTVAPRKLARLARAVDRGEVGLNVARSVVGKIIKVPSYTIDRAFSESVEQVDFEHGIEQQVERVIRLLSEHQERSYLISPTLSESLRILVKKIREINH
jgi:ParB family transcriptional regulator, chromosome partitioning protein